MAKLELAIYGISPSATQSNAYTIILGETDGKRRLAVVIGTFEAQAIAIELEKMKPNRPLTHDLFKSLSKTFKIEVIEVVIHKFSEGVFYAKLVCEKDGAKQEIDARTSDAVAIALRFQCPIYTTENVMKVAGVVFDEGKENVLTAKEEASDETPDDIDYSSLTLEELNELLLGAIDDEAYEKASKIRDEIKKRK
jgi:uncharacterized protein